MKASPKSFLRHVHSRLSSFLVLRHHIKPPSQRRQVTRTITKALTASDVGSSTRLTVETKNAENHIIEYSSAEVQRTIQEGTSFKVKVYDKDTKTEHDVSLKRRISSKSRVFLHHRLMFLLLLLHHAKHHFTYRNILTSQHPYRNLANNTVSTGHHVTTSSVHCPRSKHSYLFVSFAMVQQRCHSMGTTPATTCEGWS